MSSTLLIRTITGASREEVEQRVNEARLAGWTPISNPSHLFVGGKPAEGRVAWMQGMECRS